MATEMLELPCYIAGHPVESAQRLAVLNPYTTKAVGSVPMLGVDELEKAIVAARVGSQHPLSRHERHEVLVAARDALAGRREEFAQLIRQEAGLCIRETRYEVGRALDVLMFAAHEALRDDGQVFSCDIAPNGQNRKIFTTREPVQLAAAITPFNHPLNQVAHKLAPAIAAGVPILLKPSEKTPLTAIRLTELLYEAGLPGWMLSTLIGSVGELIEPMIQDPRVELVTFTGSANVGKRISATAGYKKLCLELGGNSPLIVMADADPELAVTLAAEGAFRNSGQRCTAVKRILVHRDIAEDFSARLAARASDYVCGDPADDATRVGTVIDEESAMTLERRIDTAVADGATVLYGGKRTGALLEPTVLKDVPKTTEMVVEESFGPLAPLMVFDDIDHAIRLANDSAFGLSSGIVTEDLSCALKAVKGIRTGTVNVNQVPGFRVECSPFGGVKDSGLGVKEGVIEAMKFMTNVKTFSLPW